MIFPPVIQLYFTPAVGTPAVGKTPAGSTFCRLQDHKNKATDSCGEQEPVAYSGL